MKRKRAAVRRSPIEQRLRRRLQEAEDTLNAIRDGHVEAVVVRSHKGEQVYTLHSADQPYRLMVEQMQEGALTLTADGTILYCNARFAEMVDAPPERVTGQNFSQFVEPGDALKLAALLRAEAFRAEFQLRQGAGGSNPAQISSAAMTIDDLRTIAIVVTDLTHEVIARGLRESNRLKDEFLATLSHELRTPLNVILGWTRMLLSNYFTDTARRHAIELIDRNARAQAQLVNDLVDMSRMTTGKLRLELEPLPLAPALQAALESARPAAEAKGLRVETSWNLGDTKVLADPTRLQQVLWNLLSNAFKFTPGGGLVTITATQVGRDRVEVEIADSGIGIDPAFLPHVFDRFRQADSGITRTHGGLGLGLAIVRELVHLHGGKIDVRSDGVGSGATFTFSLPTTAVATRASEHHVRSREAASLTGCRIMLLEDHEDSRELLAEALQNYGAEVVAFGAADEAFEALGRVKPSVIVADIALPDEDGYSFIRRVRAHSAAATKGVPAIAVTAYSGAPDQAAALAVGFQRHLAKPVDPGRLVEVIHDLTRRGRR